MPTFNDTTYTVIHNFSSPNGYSLFYTSVIEPINGTLYGVTRDFLAGGGGPLGEYGTIYSCNLSGGNFTILYRFSGGTINDGDSPMSTLFKASDGNLYGTTQYGGLINIPVGGIGINGYGTIFKFDINTNQVTILHRFSGTSFGDGDEPFSSPIIEINGVLYGTTGRGGYVFGPTLNPTGFGTIYTCNTTGNYGVIHKFLPDDSEGNQPMNIVYGNNGYFYGVCYYGGNVAGGIGQGTLYKSDLSGNLTILRKFSGQTYNDGLYPTSIMMASDGVLYGTTQQGGTNNEGTIFKYNPSNGNYSIIHNFTSATDGRWPQAELMEYNNTKILYGTAALGGTNSRGTIFSCTTSGNFGVIHQVGDYIGGETSNPRGKLLLGSNGSLFGTIQGSGSIYTWIDNEYCEFSAITSGACANLVITDVQSTRPICGGNGSIFIDTSGGCANYIFTISDGKGLTYTANTPNDNWTFTGLSQNTYYITVTDCSGLTVTYLTPLVLTNEFYTNVSVLNNENICITVTGGTQPYTVSLNGNPLTWNYSNNTNCYSASCGTNYVVNISDVSGCTATTTVSLSCETPTIVFSGTGNPTCTDNGYVGIEITGGDPNYTISGTNTTSGQQILLNNQTSPVTITGLGDGTWYFVAIDSNGSYSNILNTTLVNTFFVDLYQTSNSTTGATYCFIVTGSSANFVEVNIDFLTFYTAYTNTINCFTMPVNQCGVPHYFEVTEFLTSGTECTYNETFTYDCPDLYISVTSTDPICYCSGIITATATGGTGSYDFYLYNITGGTVSVNDTGAFNSVCEGDYYVVVVDSAGNSLTSTTVTLTQTFEVTSYIAAVTSSATTYCITITGGSGSYQLGVDPPPFIGTLPNGTYCYDLTPGDCYNVIVYDIITNCSYTAITCMPGELFGCLNVSYTDPTCDNGFIGNGTITVAVTGGTPNYTYYLYQGATLFDNSPPQSTLNPYTFTNVMEGTYDIEVIDGNGTTLTCFTNLTLTNQFQVDVNITNQCSDIGTFCVTVSGGTSPYTILVDSTNYNAISAGTYCYTANCGTRVVTVLDSGVSPSCSYTETINLKCGVEFSAVTFGGLCFGTTNSGFIKIFLQQGNPPYQYSINNGTSFSSSSSFTGLTAGTYSVIAKDISGCSATTVVTLSAGTQISASTISVTGASCTGLNTLQLTLNASGGTPPYTYYWSVPINDFSQTIETTDFIFAPGNYSFSGTVTDSFGCTKTVPVSITLTSASTPTLLIYSAGTLYCDGSQYVTLSASVSPSYSSITWSTGVSNVSAISATTPGNYYYVINYLGCFYTSSTVSVNYPITTPPEIGDSAVLCLCDSTTLSVIPNGNTYTNFVWNTSQSGTSITVSSCTEGSFNYYLTAKDIYGCTVTSNTVTVTFTPLEVNLFKIDPSSCSSPDGYAEVQIVNGVGPFTFYWTGTTSSSNIANNLLPGTYTVKIEDSTGCNALYTFTLSCNEPTDCVFEPVRNLPLPGETEGSIILNPDGTISFYNPIDLPIVRVVDTIPEECCLEYSTPDLPLQYCNGKCYWEQPGCDEELPQKIILGTNLDKGVLLSKGGVGANCQNQVSFDFLFNFDCESLFECVSSKYAGNILTFLSGLSASATIEVLTGSTYVTRQTVPIWKFDFNKQPTGVYFNGDNTTFCELIDELIKNDLGSNCTAYTNNTFATIWQHASFKLYDSLSASTIKIGLILEGFNCDYNILLDNIKIEQVCLVENEEILSDNTCPGFELEKIVDNKKSWIDNDSYYDRTWQHLKYRDTSYDDYNQRLDINTKEIDLEIDIARAIEYDAYCYATSNGCYLGSDCDNPEEMPLTAATTCFVNTLSGRRIEFLTNGLTGGLSYTFNFDVLAGGFGTATNLLLGVKPFSGGTDIPLIDNITVSANGTTHYTYTVTLPSTYANYDYIYFRATAWNSPNPLNPKTYCMSGSTLSVKEACNPLDLNLNNFIQINSETTFNEFRQLVQTQLIDAKNRQSISDYPLLRYMFDKYLDICGLNNCYTKSAEYNYDTLNNFVSLIGDYWIGLMEQFVPATAIWKGGTRTYRNTIFDQPKFEYRNFTIGYCDDEYCFEGDLNEPTYSAACYVAQSGAIPLTPVGFSGISNSIVLKFGTSAVGSLIQSCSFDNDLTCCLVNPIGCFVSANVGFEFTEGTQTVTHSVTTTNPNTIITQGDLLNIFYSGLTGLGYSDSYPNNNLEWSKETTTGCNDPITVTPVVNLIYSCITASTIITTATTGSEIIFQSRYSNFLTAANFSNTFPVGKTAISGGTMLYGVATDVNASQGGYIYSYNVVTSSFNVIKSFNLAVDNAKSPASGLVLASDGYLYGTTLVNNTAGIQGYGALYRINPLSPTTTYSVLHTFAPADGGTCWVGQEILYHSNNKLYIPLIGSSIYEWNISTQTGSVLYNFGANYRGFFLTENTITSEILGTSNAGGASSSGFIFKLLPTNPLGTFTITHSFKPTNPIPNNIINPSGPLLKGTGTNFYGLTNGNGGQSGYMSLYRYDSSTNAVTTLHRFINPVPPEGRDPKGSLVLRNDRLYGICTTGGGTPPTSNNYGNIFQYDLVTNSLVSIKQFTGTDGLYSTQLYGNLQYNSTDGYVYGVAPLGGSVSKGNIYRFTFTGGTFTASTQITGVGLYSCNLVGTDTGISTMTWDKLLVSFSSSTYVDGTDIDGISCLDYCATYVENPNVEIIVEDYTNLVTDPCKAPTVLEQCNIIYATHIDNDIWFDGSVSVTVPKNNGPQNVAFNVIANQL